MPELPEVETIVQGLNKTVKNCLIKDVWTDWPAYFKNFKNLADFKKCVVGRKILNIKRRAKNVIFNLSGNYILLIHQKISGHLLIGKWRKADKKTIEKLSEVWQSQKWIPEPVQEPLLDPMNRFIRLIFFLDSGLMIALSDLRRFAKIICGPAEKVLNLPDLKNLGPEPLDPKFDLKKFKDLFKNKKGKIKVVLMDQNFISGIGNIYSDEILWQAKIHPLANSQELSESDLKNIYAAMKFILKKALKLRGSSIDDYRDVFGQAGSYDKVSYVYQREGKLCPRCRTEIKRLKIGGRSAHYCPECQKLTNNQ